MQGNAEERLRERLTSLYDEAPVDEQALLLAVLARADGAEVSGFTFGPSAVSLLGPGAKARLDEAAEGPAESLSLNFTKINWTYTKQDP